MNLTIATYALGILLRFTTPDHAGTYYVLAANDPWTRTVIASGRVEHAECVTVPVPCCEKWQMFSVKWERQSYALPDPN